MPVVGPMIGVLTNGSRDADLSMHGHASPDRIRFLEFDAAQLVGEALNLLCAHLPGVHNHVVTVVHPLLSCGPLQIASQRACR